MTNRTGEPTKRANTNIVLLWFRHFCATFEKELQSRSYCYLSAHAEYLIASQWSALGKVQRDSQTADEETGGKTPF